MQGFCLHSLRERRAKVCRGWQCERPQRSRAPLRSKSQSRQSVVNSRQNLCFEGFGTCFSLPPPGLYAKVRRGFPELFIPVRGGIMEPKLTLRQIDCASSKDGGLLLSLHLLPAGAAGARGEAAPRRIRRRRKRSFTNEQMLEIARTVIDEAVSDQ